ncbi:glycosyltransferase family 4 protein [Baekduia soli]|uniref:Glycosyltransferase family 4 protein n=1 Tax=Baekduia soli TaxID=496014 RepID=A0A5B8U1R7_9ACTN|nr:glycosyltransferase family 4 protein [Baekduia soli]QEC46890.1 glycosyltransferase family 4 protein [Baekduia soli]
MDADDHLRPLCLLLLPRELEQFILRDQVEDLMQAQQVVAVDPPRIPYGALVRMPPGVGERLADGVAKRLVRALRRNGDRPRVVVIFHPVQILLGHAILRRVPGCELWYGRWDRYEHAYDAGPARRRRLEVLHDAAARMSSLTFVASEELARLEEQEGRRATLVPLSADTFPAPDPAGAVVAVSLGHLGWRTDWTLLREVAQRMPGLVLLLVGAWHDDECRKDPDYAWCRAHPGFVWLGPRTDEEAARLILCADVGIVPFKVEPFNDAGLPYRILKYARLGRRTVAPDLAGVRTWERAVTTAAGADAFAAALAAQAGRRTDPDEALRIWALEQTARAQNGPLWERLWALGLS